MVLADSFFWFASILFHALKIEKENSTLVKREEICVLPLGLRPSRSGASPKWGWDFLVCCFSGHLLALPAAAGTAAASATSAAASAVRIYYVVIGSRFTPPYKYMMKCIQQKQQQK